MWYYLSLFLTFPLVSGMPMQVGGIYVIGLETYETYETWVWYIQNTMKIITCACMAHIGFFIQVSAYQ